MTEIKDLAGLSEPLTKLIESVSLGLGALYKPLGTVLNAKAESYKIKKIADSKAYEIQVLKENLTDEKNELLVTSDNFEMSLKGSSIETRAVETMIHREVKKQLNMDTIINKAAEFIKENDKVSDEPVDVDWMTKFINISQDISNEEMQNLWAKILADEVAKPKTYSLRALEILKDISSDEARLFTKIVNLSFAAGTRLRFFNNKEYLSLNGLTLDDISILEELNLIASPLFYNIVPGDNIQVVDSNKVFCIENTTDREVSISFNALSRVGQELSNLIQKEDGLNNFTNISKIIKSQKQYKGYNGEGLSVYYMNILHWDGDIYTYNKTKIPL